MTYLLDYDYEGLIDPNTGKIIEVDDIDAINNSLIMFIQLQAGETIEAEYLESPVYQAIQKPLQPYYAESIADLLFLAIDNYFIPRLNITELLVYPNIDDNQWDITISAEVPSLDLETSVSLSLDNSTT